MKETINVWLWQAIKQCDSCAGRLTVECCLVIGMKLVCGTFLRGEHQVENQYLFICNALAFVFHLYSEKNEFLSESI